MEDYVPSLKMLFKKLEKILTVNYLKNQWIKDKTANETTHNTGWNNWSCEICEVRTFNIRCTMASGTSEKIDCCIQCLLKEIPRKCEQQHIVPSCSVNYYYTKEELMLEWEKMGLLSKVGTNKVSNTVIESDEEEVSLKRKRNSNKKIKGLKMLRYKYTAPFPHTTAPFPHLTAPFPHL